MEEKEKKYLTLPFFQLRFFLDVKNLPYQSLKLKTQQKNLSIFFFFKHINQKILPKKHEDLSLVEQHP